MAVRARHHSHAFAHDLHALRAMEDAAAGASGSVFLDGCVMRAPAPVCVGDAAALVGDFPRSELTCNYDGFEPRKRARIAAPGSFWEDQRAVLSPAVMQGLVSSAGDVQNRAAPSGDASTSGRVAANGASVSRGILSRLYQHGVEMEIDALIRLESERMVAVLEEARRRQARAVLAAVERATSARVRATEAELERALRRNAELEEKARQVGAECQAWMGVARSHEAVAAGLRAALDQLLQPPCAAAADAAGEAEAEDARSCCFETPDDGDSAPGSRAATAAPSCRRCAGGEACVLLLPCRHLCLCRSCEPAVDACPVCAAAKNASLHVLLS